MHLKSPAATAAIKESGVIPTPCHRAGCSGPPFEAVISRSASSSIKEFATRHEKKQESRAAHTQEVTPQPGIGFAEVKQQIKWRRDDAIPILG